MLKEDKVDNFEIDEDVIDENIEKANEAARQYADEIQLEVTDTGSSRNDTEQAARVNQKRAHKNRRRRRPATKGNKVKMWLIRVGITFVVTLILLIVGLYGVMAMLVYGPSKTAKDQFVMSVQETSAIGFLANWFCSDEEIAEIKKNNSVKDTDEITDTNLVQIEENATATDAETPDIEVFDVKGGTYRGKLMKIKDPSRLMVGTIDGFKEGDGTVVSAIAQRYDAIAGVNGGEFVDGGTTWTGMPVGLVMVNGEVVNGDENKVCHVTGITNDSKLVMGNMDAATAREKGIRDCVSISSSIGPFLVINGEAQDVSGTGGGMNPRTAIGQTANGSILLLAIDGRQVDSLGASFSDLQDIMLKYGAVNASTMDGGTSTQMYYNGEVINTPYSPTGPRTCPTAFLIK